MAEPLRAITALPEDPSSVPPTHDVTKLTSTTAQPQEPDTLV